MADQIQLRRDTAANWVSVNPILAQGELGLELDTDQIKCGDGVSTWTALAYIVNPALSGDVVGPSSATDNALARFDTTTGKLIQNGTVTQDDNGNLANVNAVSFDTTPATLPTTAGSMFWDTGNGTPSVVLNANVDLQVGQEMLALVYNGTGSTITNGSVVAVTGAQGQRPSVSLADADSEALSAPTLGIATEDIANGAEGFVTTFGFVRGLNTSAFTAGAPIYLSQTAGQFTATRPSAPAHTVALGWVIKVNASSGEVFVNINNGWELDELHNVLITSPTSGNTLIYDAVAGVWENANISAGTGISVTNGAGSISIANTGVTSVGATSPIASSGGATPTISISQATTSTNGYLSSTDWNTFNNKQPAGSYLTTVTASSPLSGSGTAGSPLVIAQSTTSTSGYLSSTDWNTFNGKQAALVSGTNIKTVNGTTLLGSGDVSVGVTSVTGTAPISSSGGATPAISISQASSTTNGYLSSTDWNTFNSKGSGTVTSISAGTGLSGGTITSSGTINLANTAVTAGSYTNANITVDAQGRITSATNGSSASGTVTSVSGTGTVAGISLSGTVTSSGSLTLGGTFALPNGQIAGKQTIDTFTATASQTTFTTSATYSSGKIDVYANGIRMRNGTDVTVTSGTQVVFASGLAVGTLVDIEYFI